MQEMFSYKKLNDMDRALMIEVMGGHNGMWPLMYAIHQDINCRKILLWLIQNRLCGNRLLMLLQEYKFDWNSVLKKILMVSNNRVSLHQDVNKPAK